MLLDGFGGRGGGIAVNVYNYHSRPPFESPWLTFGARLDILRLENTRIFTVAHDLL